MFLENNPFEVVDVELIPNTLKNFTHEEKCFVNDNKPLLCFYTSWALLDNYFVSKRNSLIPYLKINVRYVKIFLLMLIMLLSSGK